MVFAYCERAEGVYFAVAFDEQKRLWSSCFGKDKDLVLSFITKYVCPVFFVPNKYRKFANWLIKSLRDAYRGRPLKKSPSFNFDHLPRYIRPILKIVSKIPHGYVTTYKELGCYLKKSPRLIGKAFMLNPFLLLIPCHRVIHANFRIGKYVLGEEIKREILRNELKHSKLKELKTFEFKIYPLRRISNQLIVE